MREFVCFKQKGKTKSKKFHQHTFFFLLRSKSNPPIFRKLFLSQDMNELHLCEVMTCLKGHNLPMVV